MNLVSRDECEKSFPFDLAKTPKFDMKTDKAELAIRSYDLANVYFAAAKLVQCKTGKRPAYQRGDRKHAHNQPHNRITTAKLMNIKRQSGKYHLKAEKYKKIYQHNRDKTMGKNRPLFHLSSYINWLLSYLYSRFTPVFKAGQLVTYHGRVAACFG